MELAQSQKAADRGREGEPQGRDDTGSRAGECVRRGRSEGQNLMGRAFAQSRTARPPASSQLQLPLLTCRPPKALGSRSFFEEGARTPFFLLFLFHKGSPLSLALTHLFPAIWAPRRMGPTPAPITRSFYLQRRRRKRRTTMTQRKRRKKKRKRKSLRLPRSPLKRRLLQTSRRGKPRLQRVGVKPTEGAHRQVKGAPPLRDLGSH